MRGIYDEAISGLPRSARNDIVILLMNRIILHIDFDSFFASVEQQMNPAFRGKPLGVTATNGRNCIIASSREAKRIGIGTGSRVYDARKICPDINLVGAHFWTYWEISKKFISICKDFSPFVEVFSIDELFMDITMSAHLFGGTYGLIEKLKTRISEEIGPFITVSIGISHNKLLAKLASGLKKPNGVFAIRPDQIETVYRICELTDICGIGERIKRRLNNMGIFTLMQLRRAPLSSLVAEFGDVEGHFLKNVGLGIHTEVVHPFTEAPDVKSVGRQYCLPQNEYDKRIVLQNVYELCEEICIKLRRLNKKARSFGISLVGTEFVYGHITQSHYSHLAEDMFEVCLKVIQREDHKRKNYLSFWSGNDHDRISRSYRYVITSLQDDNILNSLLPIEGYIRRIGVWAGYLDDTSHLSLPLFDDERRKNKLARIIDRMNDKFGDHTIRNGFLLYADKLTTVPNGYMADKFERMKLSQSAPPA